MLRHFYLLVLLLCIEWTLSYNYIDDASGRNFNNFGRHVKKSKKLGRNKNRKNLIRQDYGYDKMPVEFDVASFIQPDEESIEEESAARSRTKKRRRLSSNDYGTLLGLDDGNKKNDKSQDFLNIGGDNAPDLNLNPPPLFKETMNIKHANQNSLDELNGKYGHDKYRNLYRDDAMAPDPDSAHNPGKKSAFKRIKIPFFSHNKSGTVETNKNKKRKLFCFNCPKKETAHNPGTNRTHDESLLQYKMKRSYEERLCPVCKKKFVALLQPNDRRKKTPPKIIHNSRQFPKNVQAKLKEDLKKIRKFSFDDLDEVVDEGDRKKRQSAEHKNADNRDRQMKELDEVQKKVDSVSVNAPKLQTPPAKAQIKT